MLGVDVAAGPLRGSPCYEDSKPYVVAKNAYTAAEAGVQFA